MATKPELKLSPFQETTQTAAQQHGLSTDVTDALGATVLIISNDNRRHSTPIVVESWVDDSSGRVNNVATVGRKRTPLNQIESCLRMLAD